MKKMNLIPFLLLLIGCNTAFCQSTTIKKIIETGKNDNQTMKQIDVLTNRFGGRPIGSDAYDNAAEWMLHQYKKWGINAYLEEAGELPLGFNRGPWFGRLIGGDSPMNLHFVTPSYTSGTKGVQRGHVVMEPTSEVAFKRMKNRLKGAWVLVDGKNRGWPLEHSAQADSIRKCIYQDNLIIKAQNDSILKENAKNKVKKDLIPYKRMPAIFYKEMVEAGVLGFIQSAKVPLQALYDRDLVSNPNATFDSIPDVCDIKLDEKQFLEIVRMVRERQDILLEFDIRNHFKLGPVKYHNVVAEIKGSKYPDEYVLITGHLDAFDVATGGIDCATGIGPMLEVARILSVANAKPKRTIRFVAFAGEEFGLLGAHAYTKKHKNELSKISYLLNRDGGPTPPVGISVPKAMFKDFNDICKPIADIDPEYPFEVMVSEPTKRPTRPQGTDASVFAIEGVPARYFNTNDFKGYDFNYGEIWHTERDLYNKNIPEYQEYTSIVTAIVALGIANLDHLLSRDNMYID